MVELGRILTVSDMNTQIRRIHHLVYCKDFANSLDKRMLARPAHLARAQALGKQLVSGGALIKDSTMCGSMLIIDMPTIKQVRKWVEADPYVSGKVWDKIEINELKLVPKSK